MVLRRREIRDRSVRLTTTRAASHEGRVPFEQAPLANDAVRHEWIAFDEFLGGFSRSEYAHGALGRIAERPRPDQEATRMKLFEPGAMSRIVLLELEE